MHTIRQNGQLWDVIFVGERGADVLFAGAELGLAMKLANYMNGGSDSPIKDWRDMRDIGKLVP